ncbi:hypothetical protein [Pleionea sp. CnH1-48]|uniref:hypothetical protein n=1 Tax=Pleionea sp. CnH1-48 TaxID=2954494 RepID=UPI0020980094|nr:hypothetical protein [Pleionea sp. CnH1-48]MCO7225785.1 hypothetical protein [Pleionea sp. CnH1-48]
MSQSLSFVVKVNFIDPSDEHFQGIPKQLDFISNGIVSLIHMKQLMEDNGLNLFIYIATVSNLYKILFNPLSIFIKVNTSIFTI